MGKIGYSIVPTTTTKLTQKKNKNGGDVRIERGEGGGETFRHKSQTSAGDLCRVTQQHPVAFRSRTRTSPAKKKKTIQVPPTYFCFLAVCVCLTPFFSFLVTCTLNKIYSTMSTLKRSNLARGVLFLFLPWRVRIKKNPAETRHKLVATS